MDGQKFEEMMVDMQVLSEQILAFARKWGADVPEGLEGSQRLRFLEAANDLEDTLEKMEKSS